MTALAGSVKRFWFTSRESQPVRIIILLITAALVWIAFISYAESIRGGEVLAGITLHAQSTADYSGSMDMVIPVVGDSILEDLLHDMSRANGELPGAQLTSSLGGRVAALDASVVTSTPGPGNFSGGVAGLIHSGDEESGDDETTFTPPAAITTVTSTPSASPTTTPAPGQVTHTTTSQVGATRTPTMLPSRTATRTQQADIISTPTYTRTATLQATRTRTLTASTTSTRTATRTPTPTSTSTRTITSTASATRTSTTTATSTSGPTRTSTATSTATRNPIVGHTATRTPTQPSTLTPTISIQSTFTPTHVPSITASPTSTVTATPTAALLTATPTPTSSATSQPQQTITMHLGDMDGIVIGHSASTYRAYVWITVHDVSHIPLPGVEITGEWIDGFDAPVPGSLTCVTSDIGECMVKTELIPLYLSLVKFRVAPAGVLHPDYYYDSQDNHDPDGCEIHSCDTITLYSPSQIAQTDDKSLAHR